MHALHPYASASRHRVEPALGIIVLFLAAYWYLGIMGYQLPQFVGGETVFEWVLLPASLLIPAAFGLLVIGSSIVVAANVAFYGIGSYYVIYFGNPGGVLLHPYVVLAIGGLLSIIVLVRSAVLSSWDAAIFGAPAS